MSVMQKHNMGAGAELNSYLFKIIVYLKKVQFVQSHGGYFLRL